MFSFSEKSELVLKDSGWFPNRKVDPHPSIMNLKQAGFTVFDQVYDVLEQLGGLQPNQASQLLSATHLLSNNVQVHFATHPSFDFVADKAPYCDEDASKYWKNHALVVNNKLEIFPIGSISAIDTLFLFSNGYVYSGYFYAPKTYPRGQQASLLFIGRTISEAVDNLVERAIGYF